MAIRMKGRINSRISNYILLIYKKQINTWVKVLGSMSGLIDYLWKRKLREQVLYFKTSSIHHFDVLALISPITTVGNGFFWVIDSIVRFNLFKSCQIHRQTDLVIYKVTQKYKVSFQFLGQNKCIFKRNCLTF